MNTYDEYDMQHGNIDQMLFDPTKFEGWTYFDLEEKERIIVEFSKYQNPERMS